MVEAEEFAAAGADGLSYDVESADRGRRNGIRNPDAGSQVGGIFEIEASRGDGPAQVQSVSRTQSKADGRDVTVELVTMLKLVFAALIWLKEYN